MKLLLDIILSNGKAFNKQELTPGLFSAFESASGQLLRRKYSRSPIDWLVGQVLVLSSRYHSAPLDYDDLNPSDVLLQNHYAHIETHASDLNIPVFGLERKGGVLSSIAWKKNKGRLTCFSGASTVSVGLTHIQAAGIDRSSEDVHAAHFSLTMYVIYCRVSSILNQSIPGSISMKYPFWP